jgi:hypothetical protein
MIRKCQTTDFNMGKALLLLLIVTATLAAHAQSSSEGKVIFKNRNIATSQPNPALPGYVPGGNNNGTYHVPIYAYWNSIDGGAGTLPGGVTVGLYYQENLLATALLGTTTASSPFFVTPPAQDVVIRDAGGNALPAGSTPVLTIRAWTTESGSFAQAENDTSGTLGSWGEWTFTSPPLGGTPVGGGAEIPIPTLTGWGSQSGSGLEIGPGGSLSIWPWPRMTWPTNAITLAASEPSTVTGEVVLQSNMGQVVLTNLTILANSAVLATHNGPSSSINASTESLSPGTYSLRLVSDGYFQSGTTPRYGPHTSAPVNVTIVAAAPIALTNARIAGGQYRFEYSATPGLKYVLKKSINLPDWQASVTNTATISPMGASFPSDNPAAQYFKVDRLPNP